MLQWIWYYFAPYVVMVFFCSLLCGRGLVFFLVTWSGSCFAPCYVVGVLFCSLLRGEGLILFLVSRCGILLLLHVSWQTVSRYMHYDMKLLPKCV